MTCGAWEEFASLGDELLRDGSPERIRAEAHFEACPSCSEKAFLIDPSWALRRLPPVEVESSELGRLQESIAGAGRIREVETVTRGRGARKAALAACALLVLVLGAALARRVSLSMTSEPIPSQEFSAGQAPGVAAQSLDDLELSLPAIGTLTPAAARVYDLGQEDFALVMVVHETLDL